MRFPNCILSKLKSNSHRCGAATGGKMTDPQSSISSGCCTQLPQTDVAGGHPDQRESSLQAAGFNMDVKDLGPTSLRHSTGLQRIHRPDLENLRHRENSLKLCIFEAKRLPTAKKRYYCEIYLDHSLYARTTSKEKTADADPFWGETFEFNNLQDVALVTIRLYRDASDRKRHHRLGGHSRREEPLGEVQLPVQDIRTAEERWFSLQSQVGPAQPVTAGRSQSQVPAPPSVRVRAHFLSVDVLPLRCYRGLREIATQHPLVLTAALEPRLQQLRAKEELAARLVSVSHAVGRAEALLTDLTIAEVAGGASSRDPAMLFRGNSVATKAIEHFLKLTGAAYLKAVLSEPLAALLKQPPSCEVEPQRVTSTDQLAVNQRNLITLADSFWSKIRTSADLLPPELPRLFALIRQRLAAAERPELGDVIVSASLFLRLICPAILGPSLFGLSAELPPPRVARALTLVAKVVQNLANGAAFGSKEPHMLFMNRFIEQHGAAMRLFLRAASRPGPRSPTTAGAVVVDLGYELAQLHSLLSGCLAKPVDKPEPILVSLAAELAAVDRHIRLGSFEDTASPAAAAAAAASESLDDPWTYSNASEGGGCVGGGGSPTSGRHRHNTTQEDWKRVLDEAQSFTTGSSGYQSFTAVGQTHAAAAVAAAKAEECSPVQFYNPTYQRVGRLAPEPPDEYEEGEPDEDDGLDNSRSDELLDSSSSEDLASSEASFERRPPPVPPSQLLQQRQKFQLATSAAGSTRTDPGAAVKLKSMSLGPEAPHSSTAGFGCVGRTSPGAEGGSGRVRMGVRARQHQAIQQQSTNSQQPAAALPLSSSQHLPAASPSSTAQLLPNSSCESELQKLQRELTDTRRRLMATEARLRSNESEKAQLMAQFQQHHQRLKREQQRQAQQPHSKTQTEAAASSSQLQQQQQMQEIMQRLLTLESSFNKH